MYRQQIPGIFKRYQNFFHNSNVPPECQQKTAQSYNHGYDRDYQVPANYLDSSDVAIKQSNYMTNVLPQAKNLNRGAWESTEESIVSLFAQI